MTFQDLLRLTQGNNSKASYSKRIKKVETTLKELAIKDVANTQPQLITQQNERILLATLESILPTAALSYRQAIIDLEGSIQKISYRGTASELREALRETLDHLAPDKDILNANWFKPEQGQSKPTMKQKVRYILKNRNINETKRLPTEKSIEMIDELIGQVARAVYNRASLSTHVSTTRVEVIQIKRYVDIILYELLEIVS